MIKMYQIISLFLFSLSSKCVGTSAQNVRIDQLLQEDTPLGRKYEAKVVPDNCDYCSLGGTNPYENTFCKNYKGVASRCRRVMAKGVEDSVKQTILDLHNDYRRKIAKGQESRLRYTASDMMELTWDDELARGAQMWANQCDFQHDENDVCRFRVGQNLYQAGLFKDSPESEKIKPAWTDAMESWYSEIDQFRENPTRPSNNYLGTGHFTQLIWAKTQYVGCGFIVHEGYGSNTRYDSSYYVCNYGPAGNWLRQKVYSAGSPCSKCPAGSTCNNGLCRDQSPSGGSGGYSTTTRRPTTTKPTTTKPTTINYWITTGTGGMFNTPAKKPKCDFKILKKYINSCEV